MKLLHSYLTNKQQRKKGTQVPLKKRQQKAIEKNIQLLNKYFKEDMKPIEIAKSMRLTG